MTVGGKHKVGIVGVSGYAGLELTRILLRHPAVEVVYLAGNHETEGPIGCEFPHLIGYTSLKIEKYDFSTCSARCDIVFVALPAGSSGKIAAELWQAGKRVIDLSGDLRLPAELYEEWYRKTPLPGDVQLASVYGLSEWNADKIKNASLISNPGCYPTAVLLGLLPIFRANVVLQSSLIVVDAKSGVSGAGRGVRQNTQYGELAENFYAYKVGKHQHTPEIEYYLGPEATDKIVFTTHLLPIIRGIFASMYIPLDSSILASNIEDIYQSAYQNAPFVHVLQNGEIPQVKSVSGSNNCLIGFVLDERTCMLHVFSAIDNLQKGAAGQAVQNMNIMLGLDETFGLDLIPHVP